MREEILKRIISWAEKEPHIFMLVQEGSLVRGDHVDEYSDLDINVWVDLCEPYTQSDQWMNDIAEVLVYIDGDMTLKNGKDMPARLVIFEEGVKVDFSFYTLDLMDDIVEGELKYNDTGVRVLLDKDGLAEAIPAPHYGSIGMKKPTEEEYQNVVNTFWYENHYYAKNLKRGEVWQAKFFDAEIKKLYVLPMLEWYAQSRNGWQENTYYGGRHMIEWLDEETRLEVESTFSSIDLEDNWQAMFRTFELFRRISIEVADDLHFSYLYEIDRKMTALYNRMYTQPLQK